MADVNVCTETDIHNVKVPIIFLGTVGFSLPREGRLVLLVREMLEEIHLLMFSCAEGEKQGGGLGQTLSYSLEVASLCIPVWTRPKQRSRSSSYDIMYTTIWVRGEVAQLSMSMS